MQVGIDGDSYVITRNPNFSGVRLDQLTNLSYSTFVTSYGSGGQAPYLSLSIDFDGDSVADDAIYFEPEYQGPSYMPGNSQGPLTLGTWQTWNALTGGWWSANSIAGADPGANVKTIAQYLAVQPNARIMNSTSGGGVRVLAGCGGGAWANFDGNLDNLKIAYAGNDTTFDFDPNPPTVVTVRPESLNGWTTAGPVADNRAGGAVNFINDATAPSVYGALQLATDNSSTAKAQLMRAETLPLSSVTDLSYYTKQVSTPIPDGDPSFQIGILLDGTLAKFTTLVYEPYWNGTVTNGNWQKWNVANGQFWSSRTVSAGGSCNVTAGAGGPPLYSLATLETNCPNAVIVSYGANVGSSNANYNVEVDHFRVNGTLYDFEPSQFKVVDDDGQGSDTDCDAATPASTTIAAALTAANPGDTIKVCPGTYPVASTLELNKSGLTIVGATATKPVIQTSGTGYLFRVTATGVTLDNLEIFKTDLASVQNIIGVQANNFTAQNNLIHGTYPGGTWAATGVTTRAFEVSGNSGLLIQNNTIHTLRQPGYLNPGTTGSILNNNVSGTRGWAVDGAVINFTGNTWGEPQNEACDIALFANVNPANYPSLVALSTANDNAFICAQYTGGENGRAVAYVDSTPSLGNGSDNQNYTTIQEGINGALSGGTVQVAAGGYNEDVNVNKPLTLSGAGADSTSITGPIGGDGTTVRISASNVEVRGFTITRAGNNTTDWNNAGLNSAGMAIQGQAITGANIHDNYITGNRTAIDVNNSNGHSIHNNVITNNRTGLIFRNQTDNLTVVENEITNNWTVGVLFLDASGGTNSPVQTAANSTFYSNNISGNWYGNIVDRQVGGSLPAPGTNLKNFTGNWLGSNNPTVTTADSGEPGYAAQIPVDFGGTATNPGGMPEIAGPASANFDFSPFADTATDTNVETVAGRGTYGFQIKLTDLVVSSASAQTTPGLSNIQEGINMIPVGGNLKVLTGTYNGNVDVNKALNLRGTPTINGTLTTSVAGAEISPGFSPGIMNSGSLTMASGSTLNIELAGTAAGSGYDQMNVTGTVNLGGATLNLSILSPFAPANGNQFVIVKNDGTDSVTGTFNGLAQNAVFFVGANAFQISYNGGDGNDVVLTVVSLCNTVSIPTGISTPTGVPVTVPINVDDTTGKGLLSYDFTITYNPAVINSPTVDSTGTLSSGMTVTTNSVAGTLRVSGFSANPLAGAGTLLKINFQAVGAVGTTSGVNFTSFMFNEGGACLSTTNGSVNIASGSITGTVSYGNALLPTPGFRPVPHTTLSATGSVNVTTTSAVSTGAYSLSGMGSGAYTVTPSKSGDVNGITSNDSARIAQHAVGIAALDPNQLIVADVSGTGGVTSFDAALIARFVVSLPGAGSTGTWKFVPTSRSYPDVTTNHTGEDYTAYLMGDVTGNWVAPSSFAMPTIEPNKEDAIRVDLGNLNAERDGIVNVPIKVSSTDDKGIISYQFDVVYDPSVLEAQTVAADTAESLSGRMDVVTNVIEPGRLKVAVYGAYSLVGEGVLLNLHFKAIGKVGDSSDMKFENFLFNEGKPAVNPIDGKITVVDAASNSEVTGRILTAAGRAVANSSVTLTSQSGEVLTVRSNTFGIFRFGGLQAGQSYTLSAESKRYSFIPVAVSVGEGAVNQDLIAQ
jgi:hypothetical protein